MIDNNLVNIDSFLFQTYGWYIVVDSLQYRVGTVTSRAGQQVLGLLDGLGSPTGTFHFVWHIAGTRHISLNKCDKGLKSKCIKSWNSSTNFSSVFNELVVNAHTSRVSVSVFRSCMLFCIAETTARFRLTTQVSSSELGQTLSTRPLR